MSPATDEIQGLRPWAAKNGLDLTPEQIEKIAKYQELLKLWNRKLSLVGAADVPLLARKHIADCLAVAAHCPTSGRIADLGSGGGMPGIVIAIVRAELTVDLVESREKKVSFLAQASQDLPNATPVNRRIETLAGEEYDLLVARALAPLERLLPLARPALKAGGWLLAMKSSAFVDELRAQDTSAGRFSLEKTSKYELPTGETRVLLHYRAL